MLFLLLIININGLAPQSNCIKGQVLRGSLFQTLLNVSEELSEAEMYLEEDFFERASDTVIQIKDDCSLDEECQRRMQETIIQLDQIEASVKESPQEELKVPSSFNFFLITQNLLKECQSVEYHLLTQICMTLFQIYECGLLYVSGDYVNLTYQVLLITTFQLLPLIPNIPMRLVNSIICVNRILMKPVPYVLAHIVQLAIRLLFVCVQSRFLKRNEIYIRSLLYVLTYLYFGKNYDPYFFEKKRVELSRSEEFDLLEPKEIMKDNNLISESREGLCRPVQLKRTNGRFFLPQKQSLACIKYIGGDHVREKVSICFTEGGKVLRKMEHLIKDSELDDDVNDGALLGYQIWYRYGQYIKHLIPLCDFFVSKGEGVDLRVSAVTPAIKYSLEDILKISENQNEVGGSIQSDFNELLLYQRAVVALHDFTRNNLCHADAHLENIRTMNGRDMLLLDLDFSKRGTCPRQDYLCISQYLHIFGRGFYSGTKELLERNNRTGLLTNLKNSMATFRDLPEDNPYLIGFDEQDFSVQVLRDLPPLIRELTVGVENLLSFFPPIYYERFVEMIRDNIDKNVSFPAKVEGLFYKEPTHRSLILFKGENWFRNMLLISEKKGRLSPVLERYLTLASIMTVNLVDKRRKNEMACFNRQARRFQSIKCCSVWNLISSLRTMCSA